MHSDNRVVAWVLFDGDRLVLAALQLLVAFCVLAGLGFAGVLELTDSDTVDTVAGGLIPGLFTFLSIVLAINQLVLTQSFGSADEVRDRASAVRAYRHDVEDAAGDAPSPIRPTDFLRVLVQSIAETAETLEAETGDDESPSGRATRSFASTVRTAADRADARVSGADPGRINAVLTLLEYEDAQQLYRARRLLVDHGDALSPAATDAVEDLVDLLELFDVARTHFRTTYTQRALSRLSRFLLYVGLPAILATFALATMTLAGGGAWWQVLLVSALLSFTLSPLALLSSYILRVAAVSERTIGVGPFVSRPGTVGESRAASDAPQSVDGDGAEGTAVGAESGENDLRTD